MGKLKDFFSYIKNLFKNKYFLIAFVGISIIGGFLIFRAAYTPEKVFESTTTTLKVTTTTKDPLVVSKLMGQKVQPEVASRSILGVVVENHTSARPQSGLDKASIVYETLAEGGITRFFVLFQENDVAEIGPVRSARPYFLDWALEYGATFAHVGGNIDALDLIGPLGVKDINQFSLANYFWRDSSRYAPHNVYTSTDKQRTASATLRYPQTTNFPGLAFKDDVALALRPLTAYLKVGFSGSSYDPSYIYDRVSNTWVRSIAGVPSKDRRTGSQIAPKNIIVEYTDFSYGTTRAGEKSTRIVTLGNGRASFFIDGEKVDGTWQKTDRTSATIYKDSLGNPVKLNPGQTWIEVIPSQNIITYNKN